MITPPAMTADELLHMPHDGKRYELVQGQLIMMSPSGYEHGEVVVRATLLIGNFVMKHGLGTVLGAETGFTIKQDPDTVRAPDVSFVARGREPAPCDVRRFPKMSPDLVVEVLSPTDRAADIRAKIADYREAGVRLIWVVDPKKRSVTEHRPEQPPRDFSNDSRLDGHEVLPGLSFQVCELFK